MMMVVVHRRHNGNSKSNKTVQRTNEHDQRGEEGARLRDHRGGVCVGANFFLRKNLPHTHQLLTSLLWDFLTSTTSIYTTSISGLLFLYSTKEGGADYTTTTIHPHQEGGMVYQGALICHKDGWWFQTNNYKETTRKKGWIVWCEGSFRGVLSI